MRREEPIIETRRDLLDHLEVQMRSSYRQLLGAKRLEHDTTVTKTILLEADWQSEADDQANAEHVERLLTVPVRGRREQITCTVRAMADEGLYAAEWQVRGERLVAYIDTITDEARRFWVVYSLSDARSLDTVVDQLIGAKTSVDRVWLWPELLRDLQRPHQFRGFGLDYDHRWFQRTSDLEASDDYLKLALWGGPAAERLLNMMESDERLGHRAIVSKVRMKCASDGDEAAFAIEDVKYNGKFTSRGTSIGVHQQLVFQTRQTYRRLIERVEQEHRPPPDGGLGESLPVFFELHGDPVGCLDSFCETMFSGNRPFRIWGMVGRGAGLTSRQVTAVDLHTGSALMFDVYRDLLCMYLDSETCGNTVARVYTHLQHTLGSRVVATGNDRQAIF